MQTDFKKLAKTKVLIASLILIGLIICSINFGRFDGIALKDILLAFASRVLPNEFSCPEAYVTVIFGIRLPRIVAAILIGGALSLAGASYQAVFRNPLVSPDILGASAGASFGAALAIFSGLTAIWVQLSAFGMSMLAVGLTYLIGSRIRRDPSLALILSGIFISSLASALVALIKYVADPLDKLQKITFWLLGSLASIRVVDLMHVIIPMSVAALILFVLRWRLNVLSLGDDEAKALGVETQKLRLVVVACATILTAASISLGGLIGWVGLVMPHVTRLIFGSNNKYLIPASAILGGTFLLLVDDVARSFVSTEIPLGVLTAIIGAPFFIFLMLRGKEAS